MTRCPGRLARWALRGVLLCGGFVGAWSLHDAVAPDAAHAAEPARPGVLGDLLHDARALVEESVIAPLRLPTSPPARSGGVDSEGGPAAADPGRSTRDDRPERPATDTAPPVKRTTVAEMITPVTRPVVDLASPVVEKVASARLLEPVADIARPVTEPVAGIVRPVTDPIADIVQPVTEPIGDLLPPVLAPILDLTAPILGPPAAPSTPPDGPIARPPAPGGDTPTAGTPAVVTRPATPAVVRPAKAASSRPASWSAGRDTVSSLPAEVRVTPPAEHAPAPGETPPSPAAPGTPATTAGAGAGAGGPGVPAEGSARAWEPELRVLGYGGGHRAALANRSSRPDPRPA